ncbi:MAG TPA: LptF/LptG family permease [Gemmatimonadales bacterium]|nr:LptF/LptG family permease [Gemmatimonadales bacterium]
MRLLSRYLLRQLAAPFVFALAALTSIMLLNQLAKRFGALVGKGLPWTVIGEVFLLSLPFIIAMTLPMAVLLAVLYAFSTLAAGNEITAMRASGISIGQLLRPVFAAALLLTAADFVFVDQGLPAANLRLKALIFDIGRKRPTLELREQALNEVPPSQLYLRAGRIDPASGRLRDVTIYDMSGQQGRQVIYADSGRMGFEANQVDLYLTLHAGSILQFKGADPGLLQLTYFTTNTLRVRSVGNELQRTGADVPKSDREMTTCEMLVVVGDTSAAIREFERQRAAQREGDLRALLALPPAPLTPRDSSTYRRPPWCGWFKAAGRSLLPETADAQRPAQQPAQAPGAKREFLKRRIKTVGADTTPVRPVLPSGNQVTSPAGNGEPRLVTLTSWVDVANTAEGIRTATRTADGYLVEVHKKYAITVACMVFVLVGIPLALRFPRGGMGLVLGGGLGIFALYYISLTAGEPLADAGLVPPAVVMWAPNVIFALLGLFGLLRVNRELGSTRGGDAAELVDLVRRRVSRWRRRA